MEWEEALTAIGVERSWGTTLCPPINKGFVASLGGPAKGREFEIVGGAASKISLHSFEELDSCIFGGEEGQAFTMGGD